MTAERNPYWVDDLREKHECYGYGPDESVTVACVVNGRTVTIVVPEWLGIVAECSIVAEVGDVLFVLGQTTRTWNNKPTGVVMIAKRITEENYAVGVWHELYPWALQHFGLNTTGLS